MITSPHGWHSAPLGTVCKIFSGATPKTGVPANWGGEIGWITPDDLSRDRSQFIGNGARSLTAAGYDSCSARLFPAGAVIYSSRAPIGYVAIATTELCTNQGCKTAVPPAYIDSRFLYWYLRWATPDIESRASGTTFKEVSSSRFGETWLVWPELAEQRRIVDVLEDHLSRLDAALDYLDAGIRRAQSLLGACIASNVAVLSAERTVLADLLQEPLRHGRSVPTADEGFPVLRLTAIKDGSIDLDERKIGAWTADDAMPYLVAAGDFLVARGNGSIRLVGRGGLVGPDPDPVAYPDTAIRVRCRPSQISSKFLALIWNADETRRQIELKARTTAGIFKINQADLRDIALPLLPLAEQAAVIGAAETMIEQRDRLVQRLLAARVAANALRRSLLEAAFSGRLTGRVSDLDSVEELAQ